MKRTLTAAFAVALALSTSAQISKPTEKLPDGFYRVQNYGTGRYAFLSDKKGDALNPNTTAPDLGSMVLYREAYRDRFCDPATVFYIERVAHKHNVHSQNTSFHEIVEHYVQIQDWHGGLVNINNVWTNTYQITPLYKGTSYYLADATSSAALPQSHVEAIDKLDRYLTKEYCWNITPVSSSGNEYLGIKSDEAMFYNGKYYKPYIIGFNMTFVNPSTKAYYVSEVKEDAVIIKEVTGMIPANTPIIVESTTLLASQNRVDLSFPAVPTISGNLLKGQYFCYGSHSELDHLPYNAQTMRVLAVKDGQLKYITAPADDNIHTTMLTFKYDGEAEYLQCVSGNSSYLLVQPNAWDELPVMTEQQYLLSHSAGRVEGIADAVLHPSATTSAFDFNGDGVITIADVVYCIQQLIDKK